MSRKLVLLTVLIVVVVGMVGVAFNVQRVEASGTIYIRADGSIEGTTYISTADNIIYTFTDNIYDEIVVERDNIVVDGAGYTLQGTGTYDSKGIYLSERINVTIKHMTITTFYYGIYLEDSSNNSISGNTITNNDGGIYGHNCSNIKICANNITASVWLRLGWGIVLYETSNNILTGNNITGNGHIGIELPETHNTTVAMNTITNNNASGIYLGGSNNTIAGNNITGNGYVGIYSSYFCDYNTILANNISDNGDWGIWFTWSSNNAFIGNTIINNTWGGIYILDWSNNNTVSGNNLANNDNWGILVQGSSNNTIYHNNFVNHTLQAQILGASYNNSWDDGYPSGGNYWNDYDGADSNNDGIGESEYVIDAENRDRYPLMGSYTMFDVGTWNEVPYNVGVVSDSTVSEFYFNPDEGPIIRFNVNGLGSTTGFCRVIIPEQLLWVEDGWVVLVGDDPVVSTVTEDADHTYLYFTYSLSTKTVEIQGTHTIPEFPSILILPLFMMATLLAVIIYKRNHQLASTKE